MLRPCWRSWPLTSRSVRLLKRSAQPSGCRSARRKVRAAVVVATAGLCSVSVLDCAMHVAILRLHVSQTQWLMHGGARAGKGKDRLPNGKEHGPDGKGHLPNGQQSTKQGKGAQAITADCSGQQASHCTSSGGGGALHTLSEQDNASRTRVQVGASVWGLPALVCYHYVSDLSLTGVWLADKAMQRH